MAREYSIDAAGKTLGRVASEAAKALMGKASAQYTPNLKPDTVVHIANAAKLRLTEKKRLSKVYTSYSGYPGGLRKETLGSLSARKGYGAVVRKAVERMLPRNASRKIRMKNLIISE